jgi:GNAT superfamily N-acetyltransferase
VTWTIRAAQPADAESLVRVHELASSELFERVVGKPLADFVPYAARLESFRHGIGNVSETARILVADGDAGLVGFAVCVLAPDGRGELKDLYVIPSAWGTGVSGELAGAALAALGDMGASEAFLWVVEANPRARRFYERAGWARAAASRASPLGPREVQYTRQLRETAPE